MRLAAIDAPELAGSPRCHGCDSRAVLAARDHLRELVRGRAVACRLVDASPFLPGFQSSDRYGRPVVRCSVGATDLSEAQISSGFAGRWP